MATPISVQVYLVEVADTERRGMFGASGALSVSIGITLVYCLGAILHWQVLKRDHIRKLVLTSIMLSPV